MLKKKGSCRNKGEVWMKVLIKMYINSRVAHLVSYQERTWTTKSERIQQITQYWNRLIPERNFRRPSLKWDQSTVPKSIFPTKTWPKNHQTKAEKVHIPCLFNQDIAMQISKNKLKARLSSSKFLKPKSNNRLTISSWGSLSPTWNGFNSLKPIKMNYLC